MFQEQVEDSKKSKIDLGATSDVLDNRDNDEVCNSEGCSGTTSELKHDLIVDKYDKDLAVETKLFSEDLGIKELSQNLVNRCTGNADSDENSILINVKQKAVDDQNSVNSDELRLKLEAVSSYLDTGFSDNDQLESTTEQQNFTSTSCATVGNRPEISTEQFHDCASAEKNDVCLLNSSGNEERKPGQFMVSSETVAKCNESSRSVSLDKNEVSHNSLGTKFTDNTYSKLDKVNDDPDNCTDNCNTSIAATNKTATIASDSCCARVNASVTGSVPVASFSCSTVCSASLVIYSADCASSVDGSNLAEGSSDILLSDCIECSVAPTPGVNSDGVVSSVAVMSKSFDDLAAYGQLSITSRNSNMLRCANAADSSAIICESPGPCTVKSKDHSVSTGIESIKENVVPICSTSEKSISIPAGSSVIADVTSDILARQAPSYVIVTSSGVSVCPALSVCAAGNSCSEMVVSEATPTSSSLLLVTAAAAANTITTATSGTLVLPTTTRSTDIHAIASTAIDNVLSSTPSAPTATSTNSQSDGTTFRTTGQTLVISGADDILVAERNTEALNGVTNQEKAVNGDVVKALLDMSESQFCGLDNDFR